MVFVYVAANKNNYNNGIISNQLIKIIINLNKFTMGLQQIQLVKKLLDNFIKAVNSSKSEQDNHYNTGVKIGKISEIKSQSIILQSFNTPKITLDNDFVLALLHENRNSSDQAKQNQYTISIKSFAKKNTENQKIIDFYLTNKLDKSLANHPLILFRQLDLLVKKDKYKTAALLLIEKRSIFFNTKNELLIKDIMYIQMVCMRYAFCLKEMNILGHLLLINFSHLISDNNFKAKFMTLAGTSAIACYMYSNAIAYFNDVYIMPSDSKKRAKAAYVLASLYEYLSIVENQKDHMTKANLWYANAAGQICCFWSMMAMQKIKKNPKTVSVYEIQPIALESPRANDGFSAKAKVLWASKHWLQAIKNIHSLKRDDFLYLSPVTLDLIKFLAAHKKKDALYRMGILCFKHSGVIIRECFNFTDYLMLSMRNNIISKDEAIELMAIANEESKLLSHSYYPLDGLTGLGVFQVHPHQIMIVCKKIGLKYNKEEFLKNKILQVSIAIEMLRYHKTFVKQNLLFSLLYYVSGHQAYSSQIDTSFLKQDLPLHAMIILSHLPTRRTRRYIISVIEYMMILSVIHYNKLPNMNFLLSNSKII